MAEKDTREERLTKPGSRWPIDADERPTDLRMCVEVLKQEVRAAVKDMRRWVAEHAKPKVSLTPAR